METEQKIQKVITLKVYIMYVRLPIYSVCARAITEI